MEMVSKRGQRYVCRVPDLAPVTEERELDAGQFPNVSQVVSALESRPCLVKVSFLGQVEKQVSCVKFGGFTSALRCIISSHCVNSCVDKTLFVFFRRWAGGLMSTATEGSCGNTI